MKRFIKIAKAIIGKLPVAQQKRPFEPLTWGNEKVLKHQEDKIEKVVTLSGFSIHYKRPYELLHTYKELFEKQIYKFTSATDEPLIIDCGSNIGLSVLYFKGLYPNAKILAFEPDVNNFALLKKNVVENQLSDVELYEGAVWIHNDTVTFSSSASEASHVSDQSDPESITVKAYKLNDLLKRYKKVDFLKIDIEGAEEAVLKDTSEHLDRVENLFLEYHGKTNETKKLHDILTIIKETGFDTYIQNAADQLVHPYVNKTTNELYDLQLNIFCFR